MRTLLSSAGSIIRSSSREDVRCIIMKRSRAVAGVVTAMCISIGGVDAQTPSPVPNPAQKSAAMPTQASGTFDVKISPQPPDDSALGRMSIDKQFHGDLEATSKGQMLAAGTAVKDSAGYVALEVVNGALRGRSGTFVLQHSGTMNRGEPQLMVTVVPDSGTGRLVGLAGKMAIKIIEGKHSYEFEHTLPDAGK